MSLIFKVSNQKEIQAIVNRHGGSVKMQSDYRTFRSYILFWLGQLVSLLGSSIAGFVIIWWITLQTESAVYLSIASLVGFAPIVILSPLAGVLADRWNRKGLIATADLLQALTTMALIFLFLSNVVSIWLILVLLGLRGVFQAFHLPTVSAIIPTMVPKEKLSRMNGLNFLFTGAVNLVGPIAAALLLQFWSISQILWIDAVTFLIAIIPLLSISIPSVRKKQEQTSFRREFGEGLAFVRNARGFLPLIILSTALNFLITPLDTLLPYFVRFDHFGGVEDLAFVFAFVQGGILAGGLFMSMIKGFKKKRMIVMALFIYVFFLVYAFAALTPTGLFWFMAIGGFIMLFCIPVINVLYMTIIQTVVPMEMQGRVNSVDMALSNAARPFGMIISGPIAEVIGTANLFSGCALSGMLIFTISWLFTDIRHVEKMEEASTEVQMERP